MFALFLLIWLTGLSCFSLEVKRPAGILSEQSAVASTLQALFSLPEFRQVLLDFDVSTLDASQRVLLHSLRQVLLKWVAAPYSNLDQMVVHLPKDIPTDMDPFFFAHRLINSLPLRQMFAMETSEGDLLSLSITPRFDAEGGVRGYMVDPGMFYQHASFEKLVQAAIASGRIHNTPTNLFVSLSEDHQLTDFPFDFILPNSHTYYALMGVVAKNGNDYRAYSRICRPRTQSCDFYAIDGVKVSLVETIDSMPVSLFYVNTASQRSEFLDHVGRPVADFEAIAALMTREHELHQINLDAIEPSLKTVVGHFGDYLKAPSVETPSAEIAAPPVPPFPLDEGTAPSPSEEVIPPPLPPFPFDEGTAPSPSNEPVPPSLPFEESIAPPVPPFPFEESDMPAGSDDTSSPFENPPPVAQADEQAAVVPAEQPVAPNQDPVASGHSMERGIMEEVFQAFDKEFSKYANLDELVANGLLKKDSKSAIDVIEYKLAVRWACFTFPDDLTHNLLLEMGTLSPNEVIDLTDDERLVLELPLMQVIPLHIAQRFLLSLPVTDRSKYLLQMNVQDLPLSSLMGLVVVAGHASVIDSFNRDRELWLKSTGFYLDPEERSDILSKWQQGFQVDPFQLQVSYLTSIVYELEFFRHPCPKLRAAHLKAHREWIMTNRPSHSEQKKEILTEIEEGISNFFSKVKVLFRKKMTRVPSLTTIFEYVTVYEQLVNLDLESKLVLEAAFGQKQWDKNLPGYLQTIARMAWNQQAIKDLESLSYSAQPSLAALKRVKRISSRLTEDLHRISKMKCDLGVSYDLSTLKEVHDFDMSSVYDMKLSIGPPIIFGWLSDRLAGHQSRLWWDPASVIGGNFTRNALLLHQVISQLKPTYVKDREMAALQEAFRQLAIGKSAIDYGTGSQEERLDFMEKLLVEHNFTWFPAGWTSSEFNASGHSMIARIERQGDRYTAFLYNSGGARDFHVKGGLSSTLYQLYGIRVKYSNLTLADLRRVHFFHPPPMQRAEDPRPWEILYGTFTAMTEEKMRFFRGQLTGTCSFTVWRLVMLDILNDRVRARALRYDISAFLIRLWEESRGNWLPYSYSHDFWRYFKQEWSKYEGEKMQRQLASVKNEGKFQLMLRIIKICSGLWKVSYTARLSDISLSALQAQTTPGYPSDIADDTRISLPSPELQAFVAKWKGFVIPGLPSCPDPPVMPTSMGDGKHAQQALDFLLENFSLPALLLFKPRDLFYTLGNAKVKLDLSRLPPIDSVGWMRPLLVATCVKREKQFAPNTLMIVKHIRQLHPNLAPFMDTVFLSMRGSALVDPCLPSLEDTAG